MCGNYEIIWGVIWNLQAVMILRRSDMLPYPLAVGSEGESSGGPWSPGSLRVEHTWARTHAHNLLLPISDLLAVFILFFSQMRFHMSKYFIFLGTPSASTCSCFHLSPQFSRCLLLGISGYAIHQGSFFPSRQHRVHIFRICAA